jgi:hypothetical protein
MFYIPADKDNSDVNKIIYRGKNNGTIQVFDALDWLARLVTHIPNKGEQFGKVNCEAREADLGR